MKTRSPGGRSTAAVLWLMILLVFLPIAAGHLVARYHEGEPDGQEAVVAPGSGPSGGPHRAGG